MSVISLGGPGRCKRKKSDNLTFHRQDLYEPSIGQRKSANAPELGKPIGNGPESMTTNPRSRNPGGYALMDAPYGRRIVGEIHDVPITPFISLLQSTCAVPIWPGCIPYYYLAEFGKWSLADSIPLSQSWSSLISPHPRALRRPRRTVSSSTQTDSS